MKQIKRVRDPFLEVIGIGGDGKLAGDIDDELYSDNDDPKENVDASRKRPVPGKKKPPKKLP
ncbi:MAG: hypothetical protein WB780_22670 [Candidatus Acidiferrales bacterium]